MAAVNAAGQHVYLSLPEVPRAEKWQARLPAVRDHVPRTISICCLSASRDIKSDAESVGSGDVTGDGLRRRHAHSGDDFRVSSALGGREVHGGLANGVSEVLESSQR